MPTQDLVPIATSMPNNAVISNTYVPGPYYDTTPYPYYGYGYIGGYNGGNCGYNCGNCGQWISCGYVHVCPQTPTVIIQQVPVKDTKDEEILSELKGIRKALETLVKRTDNEYEEVRRSDNEGSEDSPPDPEGSETKQAIDDLARVAKRFGYVC